jgi:hypothetical protein
VALSAIEIYGDPESLSQRYGFNGFFSQNDIHFNWISNDVDTGIESVTFLTQNGSVRVD